MKRFSILVGMAIIFCFAASGFAGQVAYEFTGRVTSVDDNSVYGGLNVGDTLTGIFSYDSNIPRAITSTPPEYAVYFVSDYLSQPGNFMTMNLNGTTLGATSSYYIQIHNDQHVFTYSDSINFHASGGYYQWNLGFRNDSTSAPVSPLASIDLPIVYSLSDWANYAGGGILWQDSSSGKPSSNLSFNFVELRAVSVPEPTTMLLLGFGLVGLAGLRRK